MVEGNASGVMCSYNAENGMPSCANGWLLEQVLREEWKRPEAVVVTDGGAVNNLLGPPVNAPSAAAAAAMALNAGSDINDGHAYAALADAIRQNLTSEATLDAALTRSLTQLFRTGLFDPLDSVEWSQVPMSAINSTEHQAINHEAALQSIVLLQNEPPRTQAAGTDSPQPLLPLPRAVNIAVVGPMAEARTGLLSDYASEQPCEDGSDECIPSIFDAIQVENSKGGGGGGGKGKVTTAAGVDVRSKRTDGIAAALALVKAADTEG